MASINVFGGRYYSHALNVTEHVYHGLMIKSFVVNEEIKKIGDNSSDAVPRHMRLLRVLSRVHIFYVGSDKWFCEKLFYIFTQSSQNFSRRFRDASEIWNNAVAEQGIEDQRFH